MWRAPTAKGRCRTFLASVLQQAGYRVGLYTSPHLKDFRERIRVDGEMIPKQKVVNFVDKHQAKMRELDLSFFETTTAMAFDHFAHSEVEVAVIETGLGGRLDATNIITPLLSVVTNVGMEHTQLLGDTLRKIAAEKAGIIKKSIPVVLGESNEDYDDVFEEYAAAAKSHVVYAQKRFRCVDHRIEGDAQHIRVERLRDGRVYDLEVDLLGDYQFQQRRNRRRRRRLSARGDAAHHKPPRLRRGFGLGCRDDPSVGSLAGVGPLAHGGVRHGAQRPRTAVHRRRAEPHVGELCPSVLRVGFRQG